MNLGDVARLDRDDMGDLEGYLQEVNPAALRALRRHRDPAMRLGVPEREALVTALAAVPAGVIGGPGERRG